MENAVIVSAVRTPVGSFGGYFKDVPATELGTHAIKAALERAGVAPDEVEEVILGCVLQAGLGQNPARQAAMGAGIPKEVPATTINMLCGSGLKSVAIASQMIRAGDVDVVVAGGMENMSRAPYLIPSARYGARMGDTKIIDSMTHDGLIDAFNDIHMGVTAENLADQYEISREEQDAFAAASQQKAERAVEDGTFDEEIVPVEIKERKGTPRRRQGRAPAGRRHGRGARQAARRVPQGRRHGDRRQRLGPQRRRRRAGGHVGARGGARAWRSWARSRATPRSASSRRSWASGPSRRAQGAGEGRPPALRRRRRRAQRGLRGAVARGGQGARDRRGRDVNPHGGAIALGHPIGASGGRILVTLLYEMKRTGRTAGSPRSASAAVRARRRSSATATADPRRARGPARRRRPRALTAGTSAGNRTSTVVQARSSAAGGGAYLPSMLAATSPLPTSRVLARTPLPRPRAQIGLFLLAYLVYSAARYLTVGDLASATGHADWIMTSSTTSASPPRPRSSRRCTGTWVLWLLNHAYLAAQLVVAAGRADLPLPPLAAALRAAAQHDPGHLADLDPGLRRSSPSRRRGWPTVGLVDTISSQTGFAMDSSLTTSFYNELAAVPSLHVGFAVAVGIALAAAVRNPVAKMFALLWGPAIALAVVATGNHYVFDIVAGIVAARSATASARVVARASGGRSAPLAT